MSVRSIASCRLRSAGNSLSICASDWGAVLAWTCSKHGTPIACTDAERIACGAKTAAIPSASVQAIGVPCLLQVHASTAPQSLAQMLSELGCRACVDLQQFLNKRQIRFFAGTS